MELLVVQLLQRKVLISVDNAFNTFNKYLINFYVCRLFWVLKDFRDLVRGISTAELAFF